jgi:hypothetical protein
MSACLDWQAFSARFFPGRGRHDLQVLKAYEAYRNGFAAEKRDRPGVNKALHDWESEGGAAEEADGNDHAVPRTRIS